MTQFHNKSKIIKIFADIMSSQRQLKYSGLIQKDLAEIFQRDSRHWIGKAFVTVMGVEMSPDLSYAKVFISLMLVDDKQQFMKIMESKKKEIRGALGRKIGKQVRIVPELIFILDQTEQEAQKMDDLIEGLNIPSESPED